MEIQDFSTVISIFPFEIRETKPGIYPGDFTIAPGSLTKPATLIVGPSVYYAEVNGSQRLPIQTSSQRMAKSIVDDFVESHPGVAAGVTPGLCWYPGDITKTIATKQADLIALANRQRNWFRVLIEMADTDWERYKNHKMISGVQRFACADLGLQREWNITVQEQEKEQTCPACGMKCSLNVVVCATCRCVLNESKFKQLSFA